MSNILRARRKSIEDTPNYMFCCEEKTKLLNDLPPPQVIEVYSEAYTMLGVCIFCKKTFESRVLKVVNPAQYRNVEVIPVDQYDLDEVPVQ